MDYKDGFLESIYPASLRSEFWESAEDAFLERVETACRELLGIKLLDYQRAFTLEWYARYQMHLLDEMESRIFDGFHDEKYDGLADTAIYSHAPDPPSASSNWWKPNIAPSIVVSDEEYEYLQGLLKEGSDDEGES